MNKQRILVLGATGMAGHIVYYHLIKEQGYDVIPVSYRTKLTDDTLIVDVTDKKALKDLIDDVKPNYVVNCVGVLIKGSADNPANAIYINAFMPHYLKQLCEDVEATLIHISTDCVFSGKKGNYGESEFKDADDTYGRSKALGEIEDARHLTLRTSIIGPELKDKGEGLFDWFMHQKGEINGFTAAIWGGITTLQLAKAIKQAIEHKLTGLLHVTNGAKINKYDLLALFQKIWNLPHLKVNKVDGKKVDKSLQVSSAFDFEVPCYEDMLLEQKQWIDSKSSLYPNYNK